MSLTSKKKVIKIKDKRLYNIWSCMKQRCNNPKHTAARWYHDKGIRICEEWLCFENFQSWALENGYKRNLTIDRIDSDKNYCPNNCQWIPLKENILKRKVTGNRISNILYRVWECERWEPNVRKRICMVGDFEHIEEAKKEISNQLSRLREEALSAAITRGESEGVIKKIKKQESWLRYKYDIEKISKKGGDNVDNIKNLELTDNPLTNIKMMVPMLNEKSREVVSYLMLGYCLGESIANYNTRQVQEAK